MRIELLHLLIDLVAKFHRVNVVRHIVEVNSRCFLVIKVNAFHPNLDIPVFLIVAFSHICGYLFKPVNTHLLLWLILLQEDYLLQ